MTHIWVGNLTIIGSDNGLSPGRRQAIIWTNAGILLIWTLGTNASDSLAEFNHFHSSKYIWKCQQNGGYYVLAPLCVKGCLTTDGYEISCNPGIKNMHVVGWYLVAHCLIWIFCLILCPKNMGCNPYHNIKCILAKPMLVMVGASLHIKLLIIISHTCHINYMNRWRCRFSME